MEVPEKNNPTDRAVNCAKGKPHSRFAKFGEKERFEQSARDVEKVVAEFERPADHGQRVQNRARPKNEDDEQARWNVEPIGNVLCSQDHACVVDQEKERDAL